MKVIASMARVRAKNLVACLIVWPIALIALCCAAPASAQSNAPTLTGISPSTAMAGAPAISLIVSGQGFVGSDVVHWNGSGLSTAIVSPTEMSAHLPASDLTTAGTDTVKIVTTTGADSNSETFTITVGMSLSSISPASRIAGTAGFTITLDGANFPKNAVATWDQAALPTTWVSASELTATVTAAQVAAARTYNVAVTSASTASAGPLVFTVKQDPVLSNIVPTTALAKSGEFTLTVNGGQFAKGYAVMWNGAALATTFVSSQQLTADVPDDDIGSAGTAAVGVASGTGISSGTKPFTIQADPVLTSMSPNHVPTGTPGTSVVIRGYHFTGNCTATWNGSPINTVYVSPTELQPYAPAALLASPGTATIVVTLNGVSSNSKTFAIDHVPTLASVEASSVDQGGPNLTVTLTGTHFVSGAVAQWNGADLATTFVSATSLTAVIPASDTAQAGIGQITVQNPDGAVTAALPFRVLVVSDSPLWNQRLVWAHYTIGYAYSYPTSGTGRYDELYPLDMSSAPPSQSPATDIQLAQAEGIDGFAVEIGTNGDAADAVLSAADAASPAFYVAPSIDLSTMAGQSASAMQSSVVSAVENYAYDAATHPSAARDNGNLVIWTFDTTAMANSNWKDVMSQIAAKGIGVTWVADIDGLFDNVTAFPQSAISDYLAMFQAGYIWSAGRDQYWDQTVSLFQLLGHNWCGAIRPGSISSTQYCDAQGTYLMRDRWQRSLDVIAGTQWIDDVTWNDYSESSGVNPTSTWNTTRADLNAFYASQFQGAPAPNKNAELYVTSPEAVNLDQATTAEAMVINPTDVPVTACIQLFDGNGAQIGSDVTETVGPDSVDAATVPIDLTAAPAGGYFRAKAIMLDEAGDTLQSVQGAPTLVYPSGAVGSVNVVYYSIPAYDALPGTVGLTLTPNGTDGEATAALTAPARANVKFAEILYNTQESLQFYASTPTTETVSTTGPGFYVARVIGQNRRVGYSNPVYVGP